MDLNIQLLGKQLRLSTIKTWWALAKLAVGEASRREGIASNTRKATSLSFSSSSDVTTKPIKQLRGTSRYKMNNEDSKET